MIPVEEYLKMVEEARGDKAHVAVMLGYLGAADQATNPPERTRLLVNAATYAKQLKKQKDRYVAGRVLQDKAASEGVKEGKLTDLVQALIAEQGDEANATT